MEKITWSENETNKEGIGENNMILNDILPRIGHILKRNISHHKVIEGCMVEEKGIGRRTNILDDLRNRKILWELKKEAEDEEKWKRQFITQT